MKKKRSVEGESSGYLYTLGQRDGGELFSESMHSKFETIGTQSLDFIVGNFQDRGSVKLVPSLEIVITPLWRFLILLL